jgi:hypothetical protein
MRSKKGSDPPIRRRGSGDSGDAVRVDRRGSRGGASEAEAAQAQVQPQRRSRGGVPVPQRKSSERKGSNKEIIPALTVINNALIRNNILNQLRKQSSKQK